MSGNNPTPIWYTSVIFENGKRLFISDIFTNSIFIIKLEKQIYIFFFNTVVYLKSFNVYLSVFSHYNSFLKFSSCYLCLWTIQLLNLKTPHHENLELLFFLFRLNRKTVKKKSVSFDLRNLRFEYEYESNTRPVDIQRKISLLIINVFRFFEY